VQSWEYVNSASTVAKPELANNTALIGSVDIKSSRSSPVQFTEVRKRLNVG
jgi:hypothetical protein